MPPSKIPPVIDERSVCVGDKTSRCNIQSGSCIVTTVLAKLSETKRKRSRSVVNWNSLESGKL
jgi:hypothetical protein